MFFASLCVTAFARFEVDLWPSGVNPGSDNSPGHDLRALEATNHLCLARSAPTVHLLSGFIAAGKSSFSKILAARFDAEVFSADETTLHFYPTLPASDFLLKAHIVKEHIWAACVRYLERGIDCVLDFSLWTAEERAQWAARARAVAATPIIYFIDTPVSLCRQRLRRRNARLPPSTFHVDEDIFNSWLTELERPRPDEPDVVFVKSFADEHEL